VLLEAGQTNITKQQAILIIFLICIYSRGGIFIKCGVSSFYTHVVTPEMWSFCVFLTQVQPSFMLNQKEVIYCSDGLFLYVLCPPESCRCRISNFCGLFVWTTLLTLMVGNMLNNFYNFSLVRQNPH